MPSLTWNVDRMDSNDKVSLRAFYIIQFLDLINRKGYHQLYQYFAPNTFN